MEMEDAQPRGFLNQLAIALLIAGTIAIVMLGRLTWLSKTHLDAAEHNQHSGRIESALYECQFALRNHYPGNPYSRQALTLALEQLERMEGEEALAGLRQVRGTLNAIRSIYQPFADDLEGIERKLSQSESN